MKNMSREKLTLLILVIVLFITGVIVLGWQSINNNRIISSAAVGDFRAGVKNDFEEDVSGTERINPNQNKNETFNKSSRGSLTEDGRANEGIEDNENNTGKENSYNIMVHVAGEVLCPGVYRLPEDARVINAVEAAGGATSLANLDSINLALTITDGEKIYIPSVIERVNQIKAGSSSGSNRSNSTSPNKTRKININSASADELQRLNGIGPGKASSIIDYRRDNGPFGNVDELLEVSGIGAKTLEKIRDDIIVR